MIIYEGHYGSRESVGEKPILRWGGGETEALKQTQGGAELPAF